jgi:pyruvate formate lyase activating enzyme
MLDYPGYLSSILWFCGCKLSCSYCYNPNIVLAQEGQKTEEDILVFLSQRTKFIDAIVLSGGECTDYHNILDFCIELKQMGFKVKIDTNGTNPKTLQSLIQNDLVDYIAIDYKAPVNKYFQICKRDMFDAFSDSLDILFDSNMDFEVRSTIGYNGIDVHDIQLIADDLFKRGYKKTYFLQKFIKSEQILGCAEYSSKPFDSSLLNTSLDIEMRS